MGIHALIPELTERYKDYVSKDPRAPTQARLLVVDLMGRLFMLTAKRKPTAAGAPPPLRMTGAQAFSIISGPIVAWLRESTVDPVTGAIQPRRAILITDKSDAVPVQKAAEHKARAEQQAHAEEKARAAGTFQPLVGPVYMDDAGLVDAGAGSGGGADSTDGNARLHTRPFDPFSVIHQRPARTALVAYLRRKFAELRLPLHAELIVDLGYAQPDVHGHHHAGGGARCHPDSRGVLLGHALCGAVDDDEDAGAAAGRPDTVTTHTASTEDLTAADVADEYDAEMQQIELYGSSAAAAVPSRARQSDPSLGIATAGVYVRATSAFRRPSNEEGEGEVLAVQYALDFACTTPTPATICIWSADSDTFAAACSAFWDAPGGCRLLWAAKADQVFDLTSIYAYMRNVERLTPERVLLACIGHGTDYVNKSDVFFFLNTKVLWAAAAKIRLPHEHGRHAALRTGDDNSTAAGSDDDEDDEVKAPPGAKVDDNDDDDEFARRPAAAALQPAPGVPAPITGTDLRILSAPFVPPALGKRGSKRHAEEETTETYTIGRLVRPRRRRYVQTPADAECAIMSVYAHAIADAPMAGRATAEVVRASNALRASAIVRGATRPQTEMLYRVFKHHAKVNVPAKTETFAKACEMFAFNLEYWHDRAAMYPRE